MYKIQMLPAGHGDCLWIEYGPRKNPRKVLIDGGTGPSYKALHAKLHDLPDSERHFDLLVITHVDADHIEGIIRVLGEPELGLRFDDVWFNGWRHLPHKPGDTLGPVQGEMLSALIVGNHPWNKAFLEKPVMIGADLPEIELSGGMKITLFSPDLNALKKLRTTWKRDVEDAGLDPGNPDAALERLKKTKKLQPSDLLGDTTPDPETLAAVKFAGDNRVANGSSIAFLAEYRGDRCLFAADAHPKLMEASLRKLLVKINKSRLELDILKVSHHGARSNLSTAFLDLIDCPRYLISTNGDMFGHPHLESIARIILKGGNNPRLFFNYASEFNQVWNNPDLMAEYGYQAAYPADETSGVSVEI